MAVIFLGRDESPDHRAIWIPRNNMFDPQRAPATLPARTSPKYETMNWHTPTSISLSQMEPTIIIWLVVYLPF